MRIISWEREGLNNQVDPSSASHLQKPLKRHESIPKDGDRQGRESEAAAKGPPAEISIQAGSDFVSEPNRKMHETGVTS
jgi:hypothetical protein